MDPHLREIYSLLEVAGQGEGAVFSVCLFGAVCCIFITVHHPI